MNLDDAMDEETMVSRSEAVSECKRHDHEPADMLAALGDHPEYKSRDILIWLGY
jgi:hypothetical protein